MRGALIAHWEPNHCAVDAVGAPHVGERTEKELITAFCDKIAKLRPQLVTFNGNSFDLPVLRPNAPPRFTAVFPKAKCGVWLPTRDGMAS